MVSRESLEKFSKWAGFIAILTIIGGALQAIIGIFAFVIGALPGVIAIILGLKLWKAKKQADELIHLDSEQYKNEMEVLVNNLTAYFKIQGILFIVSVVFFIVVLIIGGLFSTMQFY